MGGGFLAAFSATGIEASNAGLYVGVAGVVGTLMTSLTPWVRAWFDDRKEERAARVERLREQVEAASREAAETKARADAASREAAEARARADAAETRADRAEGRILELERRSKNIERNDVRIAAVEGKTESVVAGLREIKWAVSQSGDDIPADAPPPPPSLLVVEDNRPTVTLLNRLFTDHGFAVRTASTAAEALTRLDEECPAWLLVDLILDGPSSGVDVLKYARDHCPGLRVAVVSAAPPESERYAAAAGLGPDVMMMKPVDLDRLLDAVRP